MNGPENTKTCIFFGFGQNDWRSLQQRSTVANRFPEPTVTTRYISKQSWLIIISAVFWTQRFYDDENFQNATCQYLTDLGFMTHLRAAGGLAAIIGTPADLALIRMQADSVLPEAERRGYKHVGTGLRLCMDFREIDETIKIHERIGR